MNQPTTKSAKFLTGSGCENRTRISGPTNLKDNHYPNPDTRACNLPLFEYLTKRPQRESLGQRVGQRLRRVRRLLVGFLQL